MVACSTSLYAAMAREPTKTELYRLCHEMGNLLAPGRVGTSNTLMPDKGH